LFGKSRFAGLAEELAEIGERTECNLTLSMTTNGVLVDQEWAELFRANGVSVTVSLDGPRARHDHFRVDHKGQGTFDKVMTGIHCLRNAGIEPGILAVCDPSLDPEELTEFFVRELKFSHFDILIPDFNNNDKAPSIANFYTKLFDLWIDRYAPEGVSIRIPKSMAMSLLGGEAHSESIGFGPIQTVTLLTDGALEPLDVLRVAGNGATKTSVNIKTHKIQDAARDPVWLEAYHASLNLADSCQACPYVHACGGGYLPHRWSDERRFDNPSVYCKDLKIIFQHIWQKISPQIYVRTADSRVPLSLAVTEV